MPVLDVNRFRMFPENLIAYLGHALALCSVHGRVHKGIEGLYLHQTRFVSRFMVTIDDREPLFVSANAVDTYSFISYYLAASPAGEAAGPGGSLPKYRTGEIVERAIEMQLNRFVGEGFHQDVLLTNHGLAEATILLGIDVDADFADISECMRGERAQGAPITHDWENTDDGGLLRFTYQHPQLHHATEIRFKGLQGGPRWDGERVLYTITIAPQTTERFCVDVSPIHMGRRFDPLHDCDAFRSKDTPWDRAQARWAERMTRLETPHNRLQLGWDRAVADIASLALLDGEGDRIYAPSAGIPLYQALFGRDSLTAAWQGSLLDHFQLAGTIETIADHLGTRFDDRYDEQPGRVIHQCQQSPLSLLGENPYAHYYGDYAGPGMFLVTIAWYFALTGDKDFVRRMKDPIRRVLEWMDTCGDRDGDGFYEYDTRAGDWGTKNQGWKDSEQAILYRDGRLVENPIATCEIQGYYYAAKQLMGLTFLALGDVGFATDLLKQAQDLKRRFNEAFWMPEARFIALALDADKRQVGSIASNAGHCLTSGIVDHDKAAAVAGRLMAPDMFSGWGVRTLSSEHPAFNPFSYHLGSVWPSENASIALGFKRYGLDHLANDVAKGILDATVLFNDMRLPEVIGGHPRDRLHPHPGIYPRSCAPQAWSSSAIPCLVQAMLGVVPMAPFNTLFVDPSLPEWLPELTLSNLHVGDHPLAIQFKRDRHGHTDMRVLENPGKIRVARMAPPDDLRESLFGRFGSLIGALLPF